MRTPTLAQTPTQMRTLARVPVRTLPLIRSLTRTPARIPTLMRSLERTPARTPTLMRSQARTPARSLTLTRALAQPPARILTLMWSLARMPARTPTLARALARIPARSLTLTRSLARTLNLTRTPTPVLALAAAALLAPWAALAVEPPGDLLVVELEVGEGEPTGAGKGVSVHYTGWVFDPAAATDDPCQARGKLFDSSRNRQRPFNFPLGEGYVIDGWEQGILGMNVGGHRCLVIPPHMAYGETGAGNGLIPPNATLIFEVEVLSVAEY